MSLIDNKSNKSNISKIYFGIENINNKKVRRASMEESIRNNKVNLHGIYRIDERMLSGIKRASKKKRDIIKLKDKYMNLVIERRKLIKKKETIQDINQINFIENKILKITNDIEEIKNQIKIFSNK
jgi:hypothetical protein